VWRARGGEGDRGRGKAKVPALKRQKRPSHWESKAMQEKQGKGSFGGGRNGSGCDGGKKNTLPKRIPRGFGKRKEEGSTRELEKVTKNKGKSPAALQNSVKRNGQTPISKQGHGCGRGTEEGDL